MRMCSTQRRISEDMLQLSRLHAGRFPIASSPFAARDIVRSVHTIFAAEARALGIELVCTASDDVRDGLRLVGDLQRITQITINLVSNALKFTRTGPERRVALHVSTTPAAVPARGSGDAAAPAAAAPDSGVGLRTDTADTGEPPVLTIAAESPGADDLPTVALHIVVADTGVGMTEAEQQSLFVPFGQANAATYNTYGGSGLGLFISKALLDLMSGTVEVASAPGRGSVFTVVLPCPVAPPVSLASLAGDRAALGISSASTMGDADEDTDDLTSLSSGHSPASSRSSESLARLVTTAARGRRRSGHSESAAIAQAAAGGTPTTPSRAYRILGTPTPHRGGGEGRLQTADRLLVSLPNVILAGPGNAFQWRMTTTSTARCCGGSWRPSLVRRSPSTAPPTARRLPTPSRRPPTTSW